MAVFQYSAKDKAGNTVGGVVEASGQSNAATLLREQGLFPLKIEAARQTNTINNINVSPLNDVPISQRPEVTVHATPASRAIPAGAQTKRDIAPFMVSVPAPILAQMYRQLATLMQAGVPIAQALNALAQQTSNPRLKNVLRECVDGVTNGYPLSATMERYPSIFAPLHVEMIRTGEVSGQLDLMCTRIAHYLERDIETKRKINRETLYPKIVLFVAGCVILLLGFLKAGMGQAGISNVVSKLTFTAFAVATIFGIWWLTRYANQFPQFGEVWDRLKMLVPGWGGIDRRYATARFTRALGTLYAGGVLLPRAVELAARACGNRAIGQQMLRNAPALMEGAGIGTVLARSGLLSPVAIQMAQTGEQTGSLDVMMDKVANYLEDEADQKSHQFAVTMGVVVLGIAAIIVGIIAVSFYGGMFSQMLNSAN